MGDHTESECKKQVNDLSVVVMNNAKWTLDQIDELEKRVIRMERAFDALGRRLEGSERHVEEEGWFD